MQGFGTPSYRLIIGALAIMAVMGGAYAVGWSLRQTPGTMRNAQKPLPSPTASASPSTGPSNAAAPAKPVVGRNPDLPPRPPLPAESDGPFGSRITTGGREVGLTFDDGPDPTYTPKVLALLRQYQVKATFCLVGGRVREYPELVRAIAADGHTLCNHSWNHDLGLGRRSSADIRADLQRTNAAIAAAVPNAHVGYFRQPGGEWSARVVSVARDLGMSSLHWAVDPQDWRRPGASRIVEQVTKAAAPGAIILLHDAGGDRQGTVSALRTILPDLSRRFILTALPPSADPQ